MKRVVTPYTVVNDKVPRTLSFGVISDFHNGSLEGLLESLPKVDAILMPGDLINRHWLGMARAEELLRRAAAMAPTFVSLGNHEWRSKEAAAFREVLERSDAVVLDNCWQAFEGIRIGGLTAEKKEKDPGRFLQEESPAFSLLLCHHPEDFPRYVAPYAPDLTLAGHAHGGQIQIRGRGLYAPGQGLLPAYTHGFYHDRKLLVSRGATNSSGMPRWGNPCEIIHLTIRKDHDAEAN